MIDDTDARRFCNSLAYLFAQYCTEWSDLLVSEYQGHLEDVDLGTYVHSVKCSLGRFFTYPLIIVLPVRVNACVRVVHDMH